MLNQDTFFSRPNAYWSDSCPFFLDLLKEKCSYWTDWGFNATFPLLPAPSIFQVPHCSPNIWGFGRPCCWGSPAVCCQQLLLLPEAHRAAAEHPTSLSRKCPLCASSAAYEHFLGFLYKSCYLCYLTAKQNLTDSLIWKGGRYQPIVFGKGHLARDRAVSFGWKPTTLLLYWAHLNTMGLCFKMPWKAEPEGTLRWFTPAEDLTTFHMYSSTFIAPISNANNGITVKQDR